MGEQFTSLHQAITSKKVGLTGEGQDCHHQAQVDYAKGKGITLISFLSYQSHDVSWETGL